MLKSSEPINMKNYSLFLSSTNPVTYFYSKQYRRPKILKNMRYHDDIISCIETFIPKKKFNFNFNQYTTIYFAPTCRCTVNDDMVLFENNTLVFGNCNNCIQSTKEFGGLYVLTNENYGIDAYQYKGELILLYNTTEINKLLEYGKPIEY